MTAAERRLPRGRRVRDGIVRAVWFLLALFLFILSLELIKSGARPLTLWFKPATGVSAAGALGAGWLLACLVLSGSPVAAVALGLLDDGSLDDFETLAMIAGSRLGASFVVLAVGFVYDLRGRQRGSGTYVGAAALISTFTVYVPAFFLATLLLDQGWFSGVRLALPAEVHSVLDLALKPIVRATGLVLPAWGQALLGIAVLVGAFRLFDRFLPVVDPTGGRLGKMATTVFRPWVSLLFGMVVTTITLSVSVSLTLLVPLTARGLVRRENVLPFILGANITTFVDTLVASVLLDNPAGFTVVFSLAASVTVLSLPLVFIWYRPYERLVDSAAVELTRSHRRLAVFVAALFLVPLGLISWSFLSR